MVYWNYFSPVCGQRGGGSTATHQSGSTFKAKYATSDFCLVQLNADPTPAWNIYYTGWNADDLASYTGCTAIHHPECHEKSISFNSDPLTVTSYLGTAVPGDGSHWRVDDWESGDTEPGSSGSGIWDASKHFIGQLHGGYSSCSSITADWYGRMSRSWNGGGTSATRMKDWLDPNNTGVLVVEGRFHTATDAVSPVNGPTRTAFNRITPNPARDAFAVEFDLHSYARVGADIFDASGRLVGVVPAKAYQAGSGSLQVNQSADVRLGPGLYFVRLSVDGRDAGSRKLIVVQ